MNKITIECDGIADISTNSHRNMVVITENPSFKFIGDINARDIVMNCESQMELLNEIEDEVIHEYLRVNGFIYNKA